MMKKIIAYLALGLLLSSCGLDNYPEPSSRLTGIVTYNGSPIYLDNGNVTFNLYQGGYEKQGPISVSVSRDGTFSALVFDGNYTLCNIDNNGPWTNDVAPVQVLVKGDTRCNVEVTPYFVLENSVITLDGTDIKAITSVRRVAEGKNAKQIFLAVGTTPFINDQSYSYIARKSATSVKVGGSHNFTIDGSDFVDSYDHIYARVGLEIDGMGKFIYTETIKIK